MTEPNLISHLLHKQMQGLLSPEEKKILDEWKAASPDNRHLWEELNDASSLADALMEYHPDNRQALRDRILQNVLIRNTATAPARLRVLQRKWLAAASLLILICTGAYLLIRHNRPQAPLAAVSQQQESDILPGRQGAVLTLANGAQVILDSLGNGVIAHQNGARIVLNKGQLAYSSTGHTGAMVSYNTMTTPKGRQFQLQLPDGTKVWLNSASSIKYPTVFTGAERKVEITGEAYFEVAKDEKKPFHVNINNQAELEVLGTHFNIHAYDNEKLLNATLLEGSIRLLPHSFLSSSGFSTAGRNVKAVVLRPGQQAQINRLSAARSRKQGITIVDHADINKVMAWKNGTFNFENASLEEAMHQLERWYDIEVVYEKDTPDIQFGGEISRHKSLEQLLKDLQDVGIHFRIEGRKLIILP